VSVSEIRHTGQLRNWIDDRHFGFLTDESDGETVFLHGSELEHSGLNIPPMRGARFAYDRAQSPRGFSAKNVEAV